MAKYDLPKGERTRLHILRVSAEHFAVKGYGRTSLADLIAASGMAKGAFYFHFKSKEDLALEVIRFKQDSWLHTVTEALAGQPRGLARFRALGPAVLDLYEADATHWAVSKLSLELGHDPALRPPIQALFGQWNALIAELIADCQAEGSFRPDVPAEAVAEIAMATFNGLKDLTDIRDAEGEFRSRMGVFVDLLMTSLTPTVARRRANTE